jgi:chitinase
VPEQWGKYKSNQEIQCLAKESGYATGEMSEKIYSTDPYADLFKWPPNDVNYYKGLIPGSTIPAQLPGYWPDLKDNIANNEIWNYQNPYKAWDGKGNLQKVVDQNGELYLSIGGWSGSIQLMKALNGAPEDQQKNLHDFAYKFLPAALPNDDHNAKQWGVFPPFNPLTADATVSKIKGYDIDLEPYANDWTQMSSTEVENYVNYITNIANAGVGEITITVSGNPNIVGVLGKSNINTLLKSVDKINLMTYDYHGAFDSPGQTNCHSPLFCNPDQPKKTEMDGILNIHSSVKAWIDAGVNPNKLVIGAAAYGREVGNVEASNVRDSLFKNFNDPTGKTPLYNNNNLDSDVSTGKSIKERVDTGQLEEKFNKESGCAYAFDSASKAFVSYDNIDSVTQKTCYAIHQGLGGIMFWDLGGDKENLLINRVIEIKQTPDKYCTGDFGFESIDSLIKQSEVCTTSTAHDEL